MATTSIDQRHPESGFVVVSHGSRERRMVFAPHRNDQNSLILSTGNWGDLTSREKMECKEALEKAFPDKSVLLSS